MKKRLAIITTHPIQYNAPLFRRLAERGAIELRVFYTWGESSVKSKFDPDFKISFTWDIPLLEGYDYQFLINTSKDKGAHKFDGIINPDLVKQIERWRPDAILIFGWSFRSHLNALRYFCNKIPLLFRGDSTLLDEPAGFSIKKIFRRVFLTYVYQHVDHALYVGTDNRRYFLKHGLKPHQLVYCPHCVDNARFAKNEGEFLKQAQLLRQSLNISFEDRVFLFAGKLEKKKNIDLLLRAFTNNKLERAHLVIVGDGALEFELKKEYARFKEVHFMNFQNQSKMPIIYRMADVLVIPSQGPGETWGLAANEAMASGTIVLMSNKCGGAKDLILEGENGYVFKSNDINDLIEKLNSVAQQESLFEMKLKAQEHISKFTIERACNVIEGVLFDKLSEA